MEEIDTPGFPDLASEDASPQVQEAIDRLPPLRVMRVVAHAQSAFRSWLSFGGALLGSLDLEATLRELTIVFVAARMGADYERVQHEPVVRALGVSAKSLAAVVAGTLAESELTAAQQLALNFVELLLGDPPDADAEVREMRASFSDREIVELILLVGHYHSLCVLTNVLGVSAEAPAGLDVVRASSPADPR
jgi:alkylhydroperoxidase family enzyme